MPGFQEIVSSLRQVFQTGKTKTYEWRHQQLEGLLRMIDEKRDVICEALYKDLHKHKFEASLMEIDFVRNEMCHAINELQQWMKPDKVKKGLVNMMDKCYIQSEPRGVCLIIGAWNYPVQLVFAPLIGALAADSECVKIVNGGVPETTELLKERFDHIFYTGNGTVGKIVMQAAAKYLTPVVLELGGKSPVFVDKGCDLNIVARRLLWGKCCNAGQTCIAPDYILCSQDVQNDLVKEMKSTLADFYPEGVEKSPDYARIVSDRHFQRIQKLVKGCGDVAIGGETNPADRFVAPTVKTDVKIADPIMQEEIFGPILPILPVEDENEAIQIINDREKPLAMYVFSNNKKTIDKFLQQTSSGGFCVNDTMMHISIPSLPFGGVGNSGIGGYHGKFTFDLYSHKRGVMHRGLSMESVNNLRCPPYTERKMNIISRIIKKKVNKSGYSSPFPYLILGIALAVLIKMFGLKQFLPKIWDR
ncbi:hypothetical protein ScPMuIL_016621 [Solemya velum]